MPANTDSVDNAHSMSIACPSATSCAAVGDYGDSAGNGRGLLVSESDGSWTAAEAPVPANAAPASSTAPVDLNSVACESATSCVAVGQYVDSSGLAQPLLLIRSGTSWTATEAPLPVGAKGGSVNSVACPSVTLCVAVGQYADSSGVVNGLLLTGSGNSWTAAGAPLPASANTGFENLDSVACPSATSCAASGNYGDSSGYHMVMVTGSGTSWTATGAPLPADMAANHEPSPTAIACSSTTSCTAVGYYTDTSGVIDGLVATGYGTTWTPAQFPVPDAPATPSVFGVSVACPSVAGCAAVGWYEDASKRDQALMATGSGSSWTASQAPLPANAETSAQNPGLPSVACRSATSCVAVGWYLANTSSTSSLAGLLLTGPA